METLKDIRDYAFRLTYIDTDLSMYYYKDYVFIRDVLDQSTQTYTYTVYVNHYRVLSFERPNGKPINQVTLHACSVNRTVKRLYELFGIPFTCNDGKVNINGLDLIGRTELIDANTPDRQFIWRHYFGHYGNHTQVVSVQP